MQVQLIEHWGNDNTVVRAARVSFNADDMDTNAVVSKDAKLIHYLAKHRHTSCFEHQGATLRLKVPIFIARQIQRHRTFSYNEVSRRYVDSAPEFFWPDKWRARADNVKQGSSDEEVKVFGKSWIFEHDMDEAKANDTVQGVAEYALARAVELYEQMLEVGVAPELARMILPQNMYTEFYMTGNLRSWNHFLSLRLDGHAQKEVQDVAQQIEALLLPLWPVSMAALAEHSYEEPKEDGATSPAV